MKVITHSPAKALSIAAKADLEVVIPDDKTLTLDIDEGKCNPDFHVWDILEQVLTLNTLKTTTSKSGNTHIYLTTGQSLPTVERLLIQVLLGSDVRREAHSYVAHKKGEQVCSMMFEVRKPVETP